MPDINRHANWTKRSNEIWMRFERVWRKAFQWITLYCTRRAFPRTSRACPWSWKNSSWYKHVQMPEWGINTTADFASCLSKHRILVGFEPTHTYKQAQRWACYYTLHTHIFSLSLAQTLKHARAGNQPASRFDTLPVLWSGQRRDGFSHHRLWSLREEEVVCVHDMGEGRYWH